MQLCTPGILQKKTNTTAAIISVIIIKTHGHVFDGFHSPLPRGAVSFEG